MITIECYKGLPLEYESFLIEKYGSYITTCRYIEIYYPECKINYMLVYEDSKLKELLIFGICGNNTKCFNSLVKIDQNIIAECSRKLFEIYPTIQKINIDASYVNYKFDKSILRCTSEDYILSLPATIEDYNSKLGCKTRKHLRQRIEKLKRDFEEVNFVVKSGTDIDQNIINKIVQFNHDRMIGKGKTSEINQTYKNYRHRYSQHYGCVAYLELNGEIVAGCITTILNNQLFLHVIAHNNDFSKYNVGEVCVYNLLQNSLEQKIYSVHFLWGKSELKNRLLAKSHLIFSYFIYRDYSIDFFYNRVDVVFRDILNEFKHSKFALPFRNTVKSIRTRKLKV